MKKTGQTTPFLRNSGAVQITVDTGTVGKTIMQSSIVTLETTVSTQPTTEEGTMRTDSRTDVDDSKADSRTRSHIQKMSRAHGGLQITTGKALQDEYSSGEWLAHGFSI